MKNMNTISMIKVCRIAEEEIGKRVGKDLVDFNNEECEFLAGYTAGMLKGLKMAGIEIKERNEL
jgi:hypothetical protein